MDVTFDKKADALYIKLQPSKKIKKTVMLHEGLMVDMDKSGQIYGIEILDVSHHIPLKELSRIKTNLPLLSQP
ncbi:MAG: hypothetical protein KCHDKBKB_02289 [Elusimicrobia bacterium]|nr:hypothetical protein [Elusimicrobiota bacterium]